MWVITEKGDARNLAQAYKIGFANHNGVVKVFATFPICTESAVIKTFDDEKDARAYIGKIVATMNISKTPNTNVDYVSDIKFNEDGTVDTFYNNERIPVRQFVFADSLLENKEEKNAI